MKIVLATGIYPPAIGGPATYVKNLAVELKKLGYEVQVLTYGKSGQSEQSEKSGITLVSGSIPILRWFSYASALRKIACDADVVYAFSSISCGVPLLLSGLQKPKRMLRLGGDFLWERYTDMGGSMGLRDYYARRPWSLVIGHWFMSLILRRFDQIVFSTGLQQDIYAKAYKHLPSHSIIENALAVDPVIPSHAHTPKKPFRLLFVGRFVPFKNLPVLLRAMQQLPDCTLTLVGDGPQRKRLHDLVDRLGLHSRVRFVAPVFGKEKFEIFGIHDLLVIPSLTDISPNTALEARSVGLPVLLTRENGLSMSLLAGIVEADLREPEAIVREVQRVRQGYSLVAEAACKPIRHRSWSDVCRETTDLFATLIAR